MGITANEAYLKEMEDAKKLEHTKTWNAVIEAAAEKAKVNGARPNVLLAIMRLKK